MVAITKYLSVFAIMLSLMMATGLQVFPTVTVSTDAVVASDSSNDGSGAVDVAPGVNDLTIPSREVESNDGDGSVQVAPGTTEFEQPLYEVDSGSEDDVGSDFERYDSADVVDYDADVHSFEKRPPELCYYIGITPEESYVFPGGKVVLESTLTSVSWSASEGTIVELSPGKAEYTAPTDLGGSSALQVVITASSGECAGSAVVNVEAGDVSGVRINAPSELNLDESSDIKIKVVDEYGNPISGKEVAVSLSVPNGVPESSLKFGNDEGLIVNAVTDDSGVVEGVFNAGSVEESCLITAVSDGVMARAKVSIINKTGADSGDNGAGSDSNSNAGSSSSSGSGSSGRRSSGSITVVAVHRNSQNETEEQESEEPEIPIESNAEPSKLKVKYTSKVYVGGAVSLQLEDLDGNPISGRKIIVTDPLGKEIVLITNNAGTAKMFAMKEGKYAFVVDGTNDVLSFIAIQKPINSEGDEEEQSFDIVGALVGDNPEALSVVAVLVVLLILIVGVGVYFLTQEDGE